MKKLLVVLAACLLVFGVAGPAKAAFTTDGELVRVMFDASTGIEVATDMGLISDLQKQTNVLSDVVPLSAFGATATWSQVSTAYFGVSSAGLLAYIAGTGAMTMGGKTWSTFLSNDVTIVGTWASTGTAISGLANSVSLSTSNLSSYYAIFDGGGANPGTYNGTLVAGTSTTEVANGTLATQYLYQFVAPTGKSAVNGTIVSAPIPAGFTIVTDYNGNPGGTEINPSIVPIPPSILLMGSGLLGLIGVGRRKLFA